MQSFFFDIVKKFLFSFAAEINSNFLWIIPVLIPFPFVRQSPINNALWLLLVCSVWVIVCLFSFDFTNKNKKWKRKEARYRTYSEQCGGEASNAPAMPAFTFFWTSFDFFFLAWFKAFFEDKTVKKCLFIYFHHKDCLIGYLCCLFLDFNMQILKIINFNANNVCGISFDGLMCWGGGEDQFRENVYGFLLIINASLFVFIFHKQNK